MDDEITPPRYRLSLSFSFRAPTTLSFSFSFLLPLLPSRDVSSVELIVLLNAISLIKWRWVPEIGGDGEQIGGMEENSFTQSNQDPH